MKKVSKSGTELKYLFERNGKYLYRRSIPVYLKSLAGKNEFKETLGTSDLDIAVTRYAEVNSKYNHIFEKLRSGRPLGSEKSSTVKELAAIAKTHELPYRPASDLIKSNDLEGFIKKFNAWENAGLPEGSQFDAIFGEADEPIKLNDALEFFIGHIRDELIGLNARAKDKKLNPKRSIIKKLIEFFGEDIDISKITKKSALEYRAHLLDSIEDGRIKGNTANKQIGHIRQILRINIEQRGLDLSNPFAGIRVKEITGSRPAFSTEFIRTKWLIDGTFVGLNPQCEALLMVMLNTGCGHSELCGLDPDADILLDHEVPHIVIRPNAYRSLKTNHRERSIPLIGASLSAMKQLPEGFSGYRRSGGAEAASANTMKFLKNNDLLQSPEHTVYSLRHMFKDRMRVHKFPSDLQNFLMGHKDATMGAHYGDGYTLKAIREYMKLMEWDFG